MYKIYIRRPLPTAGGARQRRDYKQQVLCSASEGQGQEARSKKQETRNKKQEARNKKPGSNKKNKKTKKTKKKKIRPSLLVGSESDVWLSGLAWS